MLDELSATSLSRAVEKGDIRGLCLAVREVTEYSARKKMNRLDSLEPKEADLGYGMQKDWESEDRVSNEEKIKKQNYMFSKERMLKEYMEVYDGKCRR